MVAFPCAGERGSFDERIDLRIVDRTAEPPRRTLSAMTSTVDTLNVKPSGSLERRNSEKAGIATSTAEMMKMASPRGISRK